MRTKPLWCALWRYAFTEALLNHDWPGNVRELRNVLERATITCEDGIIGARDLSLFRAFKPAD